MNRKQQINNYTVIIPCRSWWPCGFTCRSEAAWLLESRIRILRDVMHVCQLRSLSVL